MPEPSGLSRRVVLERLIGELPRLRPDAREPEFKNWRTRVNSTMPDLFGPRHKLTLALRDVTFTPDFERGRARALALLRAALSLAADQPAPEAAVAPTSSAAEKAAAQPAAAEPVPLRVAAEPVPDKLAAEEPLAAQPAPAPVVEFADVPEPAVVVEPDVPDSTDWVDATAVAERAETITEAPANDAPTAATDVTDHAASVWLYGTSELEGATQPELSSAATPDSQATEPKRAALFRRIARRRDSASAAPAIADEPVAATPMPAPEHGFAQASNDEPPVPDLPATASAPQSSGAAEPSEPSEPAEPAETTQPAEPAEPAEPESMGDTCVPPETEPVEVVAVAIDQGTPAQPEPSAIAPPRTRVVAPSPAALEPVRVAEPAAPKRESKIREYVVPEEEGKAAGPDTPWTPQAAMVQPESSWAAPAISEAPVPIRLEAARRSGGKGKRLAIAATIIVFLGLGVGFPAWLWFGGWTALAALWPDDTTNTTAPIVTTTTTSPSVNARVVDVAGDPRRDFILQVVRAGIVKLEPNGEGEVSFLPAKPVGRGEFLVWLDRVRRIPVGSRDVPDTFYYDLKSPLRLIAVDAYERRILVEWPGADTKIAFHAADPILVRDAEAWVARMIVGLLPAGALQSALEITAAEAADLRARISSLKAADFATIMEGFDLLPGGGWATAASVSRSEAAELLIKLKALFDQYPAA